MADNKTWAREQTDRVRDFYNVYTRGFSAEEFQRLFTRDTRDAYRYFSRGIDRRSSGRPALVEAARRLPPRASSWPSR